MMETILISVIVPAYNIEAYISRCLDSLIQQTYPNLEIIVVDDGSVDRTGEIIKQCAEIDPRIVPVHKNNEGVSKARMTGIERANGAYIGFIDGDDCVEPSMFEKLLDNALKYQADISHCGYKLVFPDGKEKLFYGTGRVEVQDHGQGLKALMKGGYIEPSLCNKLFDSKVIKNASESEVWDPDIKINEDLLLNYIAFKASKRAVYEDITPYHYIKREGSASSKAFQRYKLTDPLKVVRLLKNDTREDKELYSIVYDRYLRLLINSSQQTNSLEDAKAAREELKAEMKNHQSFRAGRSKKLRIMAFGAIRLPRIYSLIRKIYDKFTGIS